jgi:hypothetical protein
MSAYYIVQWQTKECYIGQEWSEDVHKVNEIVKHIREQKPLSLQVFIMSKDGDVKELDIYYEEINGVKIRDNHKSNRKRRRKKKNSHL